MTRLYGHTAPGGAVGLRLDCHQHPRRREGSTSRFGACVRVAEPAPVVETAPDGNRATRSPTAPICFCRPALLVWTDYATPVDSVENVPNASQKKRKKRPGSQSQTSDELRVEECAHYFTPDENRRRASAYSALRHFPARCCALPPSTRRSPCLMGSTWDK